MYLTCHEGLHVKLAKDTKGGTICLSWQFGQNMHMQPNTCYFNGKFSLGFGSHDVIKVACDFRAIAMCAEAGREGMRLRFFLVNKFVLMRCIKLSIASVLLAQGEQVDLKWKSPKRNSLYSTECSLDACNLFSCQSELMRIR